MAPWCNLCQFCTPMSTAPRSGTNRELHALLDRQSEMFSSSGLE